ncbi:acyl carrier protein [Streptomyces sp. NPDC048417]|uniref:acyl carrier protein n=1 Tax=Streptomyces sp. NPDC048417 TaxID=3155387 RepID=UPI00341DE4B3
MTLDELIALLRECAGQDEALDLDRDVSGVRFTDLGYDSLAVLQTIGRIEQEHGVQLPDETVADADTPGRLLTDVNDALASAQRA